MKDAKKQKGARGKKGEASPLPVDLQQMLENRKREEELAAKIRETADVVMRLQDLEHIVAGAVAGALGPVVSILQKQGLVLQKQRQEIDDLKRSVLGTYKARLALIRAIAQSKGPRKSQKYPPFLPVEQTRPEVSGKKGSPKKGQMKASFTVTVNNKVTNKGKKEVGKTYVWAKAGKQKKIEKGDRADKLLQKRAKRNAYMRRYRAKCAEAKANP